MGEVLYLHYLPVYIKPETKNARVAAVLEWSPNPVAIPAEILDGFQWGFVFQGIGMALIPFQVGTLIESVEQWKALGSDKAERLSQDPWQCKDFLAGLCFHSRLLENCQDKGRGEHHLLLHSIFPDTFEPMLLRFKRMIVKAKAFARFLTELTEDIDRAIQQIRRGIEAELGRDFSFHDADIIPYWKRSIGKAVIGRFRPARS